MAKKTCAHRKTPLTPCYAIDGDVSLDAKGNCMGCGKTRAEIDGKPIEAKVDIPEIVLTEEQDKEMRRIHKVAFAFHKAMEVQLAKGIVAGKTGWNKDPGWTFVEKLEAALVDLKKAGDVPKACADIANYAMMIWHRTA